MEVSMEEKKEEAVKRMEKIGLFPEVIWQFKNEDQVNESEPPWGACYWLNEEQEKRVKEFEDDNRGALVYHVISGKYILGGQDVMEMECYLYVSDYKEDWPADWADLEDPENLQACCYVYNVTDPELSELGAVGFKIAPNSGGLLRTW